MNETVDLNMTVPQKQALADGLLRKKAASAALDEEARKDEATHSQMTAAAVLLSASGSSTGSSLQNELLAELLGSLRKERADKEASVVQKTEERNRMHLAQVENLKQSKANHDRAQLVCDHRKEDGRTRICGQRTSDNHLALLCNLCYKTFDEATVPPHLMPRGEFIGG